MIFNGDFRNPRARCARKSGNKSVQVSVKLNLLQNFAAVGFERGAKVMQIYSGKFGHHPTRHPARNLAQEPVVLAGIAPAADQVKSFLDFFQELGNFFRIVMQIAVHGDDDFTAGKIKSGFERGSLTKISPETNQVYAAIMLVNFREDLERIIFASV